MGLLLKNLCWQNETQKVEGDVRIRKNLIQEIGNNLPSKKGEHVIDFKNHYLYPGLINAHDHLEMNLYSKLGTPPYNNYVEWANDIYKPDQSPIREIEKVSIKDRLLWGGIKNLISGVTTVVHHNPWHRILGRNDFPVKVLKTRWAHSLALGKKIEKNFTKKSEMPFIIHAAEGLDKLAFAEIKKLNELGLLKKNSVLIHAIALDNQDINLLSQQQSSIVWCPASNHFMFNQTALVQKLKGKVKIALGSDSTLTGSSTLLDEMFVAVKTGLASSQEAYSMVTNTPAEIFHVSNPVIAPWQQADLFVTSIKHENYFENMIHIHPSDIALVLTNGKIKLMEEKAEYDCRPLKNKMNVNGAPKYVDLDVSALRERIEKKVGLSILEANPLWNLIET